VTIADPSKARQAARGCAVDTRGEESVDNRAREEDRNLKLDIQLGQRGLEGVVEEATSFERLGFDAGWTSEAGHDPFLPVALVAAATKTLSLGTNIAVAFARSPMSMAQVAWDLQKHSKGRFHLGLGTQVRAHIERRYSMPYEHPEYDDFARWCPAGSAEEVAEFVAPYLDAGADDVSLVARGRTLRDTIAQAAEVRRLLLRAKSAT
jgi:alkanesulfonate monooxygenase SsuD/methylene tetrahydromethanopterin reductase-like flavin-dependent oxidoreductase (luciferase family)